MTKFAIGETVLWNRNLDAWNPTEYTIEKTGRKWCFVKAGWRNMAFDIETGDRRDAESDRHSYGAIYRTFEEWRAKAAAKAERDAAIDMWCKFRDAIARKYWNEGVTSNQIRQAAEILGIALA